MVVTNQDPATWVAATPGSAAWRRQNDGLSMRPSFTLCPGFARTNRALVAPKSHTASST